jgi:hypothetical protein
LSHARPRNVRETRARVFAHKKIGGKRIPLAAIGIDFNRILLSA